MQARCLIAMRHSSSRKCWPIFPIIYCRPVQAFSPTDAPYTMIVVPLLFESGRYANWLQRVITVDCPEESQIARTTQRSKLDEPAVRAIMAQQLSREARLALADEIIVNNGSLDNLKTQVIGIHRRLSAFATETD